MTAPLTVSVVEAAALLGIGKNTAYDLVRAGRLPHVRIGSRVRIPRESLHAWLEREAERSSR